MRILVLDLELNKNTDLDVGGETTDIIQIGAVVYDTETREIVDKFNEYCSLVTETPIDNTLRLSKFIIKLTGITQETIDTQGIPFDDAYDRLCDFFNRNKCARAAQWGGGDFIELNAQREREKFPKFNNAMNIKHIYQVYAMSEGFSSRGGLSSCLKKLGMKFEGRPHNALCDAHNTALVLDRILVAKYKSFVEVLNEVLTFSTGQPISSQGLTDSVLSSIIIEMRDNYVKKIN